MLLTATERLTMNTRPKNPANARNLNFCGIGSSGSGKTRFWLTPQLLQAHSSYVVVDPKGGVLGQVGSFLQKQGYKIKVFNSIDFSKSMHYNPLAYIKTEADILKFVNALISNTKGEGKEGDPFWTKAETLLYCALLGYIIFEGAEEDRNMNTLVDMISGMEVKEDDEDFLNAVDYMFKGLEQRKPNCFAVKQYKKYKLSFRDGHYYVFDGQHTIVARKHMNGNNDLPILCKVYYGMTEAEEALLFAMQTGYSAALTPSAKLRANLHGEDKASGEFYEATEEAGLHVGFERGGGVGRIICINTAFAEFRRAGAELYKEALTLLLEAWGGDPDSLRAEIIQGIVHFVELYHGEYDRERLIYSLRAYEPKFIYAAGKAEKELRGVKRYVNIFYRIYNGRRRHEILPMKF